MADTPCKARRLSIKGGTMELLTSSLAAALIIWIVVAVSHLFRVDQHS